MTSFQKAQQQNATQRVGISEAETLTMGSGECYANIPSWIRKIVSVWQNAKGMLIWKMWDTPSKLRQQPPEDDTDQHIIQHESDLEHKLLCDHLTLQSKYKYKLLQ